MNDGLSLVELLKSKGKKLTKQRQAIFDAFSISKIQLMTAEQLYFSVSKLLPGTNFSTVYRNLDLLVSEGIFRKVMMGKQFAYEINIESEHHHHLICVKCGKVKCFDYCPIEDISKENGFVPTEHKLEIFGYCKSCNIVPVMEANSK